MAESSDPNTVPKGTTLVFGSWACMADGSGGFSGHLIASKELEMKLDDQPTVTTDASELGGNRVLPKLEMENIGHMSTPTHSGGSAESDTNPNSENSQFSQNLGKCVAYLKSIKHSKIVNSELLDGVDRVSQLIKGCIKLAESALDSSKTQQNLEASNPRFKRTGNVFLWD